MCLSNLKLDKCSYLFKFQVNLLIAVCIEFNEFKNSHWKIEFVLKCASTIVIAKFLSLIRKFKRKS